MDRLHGDFCIESKDLFELRLPAYEGWLEQRKKQEPWSADTALVQYGITCP